VHRKTDGIDVTRVAEPLRSEHFDIVAKASGRVSGERYWEMLRALLEERLESKKGPVEFLVIEHAEEPPENQARLGPNPYQWSGRRPNCVRYLSILPRSNSVPSVLRWERVEPDEVPPLQCLPCAVPRTD
jgi:hypothetical protein